MKLIQMSDKFSSALDAVSWAKLQTQLTSKGYMMYIREISRANSVPAWVVYRTVAEKDYVKSIYYYYGGMGKFMSPIEIFSKQRRVIDKDDSCYTVAEYMKKYYKELQ